MSLYSKYARLRLSSLRMRDGGGQRRRAPWIMRASREILVFTAFSLSISSQDKPNAIIVGRSNPVVEGSAKGILLEPHLALDPTNNRHLLLGAISILSGIPTVVAFDSEDGGQL